MSVGTTVSAHVLNGLWLILMIVLEVVGYVSGCWHLLSPRPLDTTALPFVRLILVSEGLLALVLDDGVAFGHCSRILKGYFLLRALHFGAPPNRVFLIFAW